MNLNFEIVKGSVPQDWVLFIHGLGGSTHSWQNVKHAFAEDFNLALVDLPGHGGSNEVGGTIAKEGLVELLDAIASKLTALGITKVNIVGLSLGSFVGVKFTEKYPHLVNRCVYAGAMLRFDWKLKWLVKLSLGIASTIGYRNFYKFGVWLTLPGRDRRPMRNQFYNDFSNLTASGIDYWVRLLKLINEHMKMVDYRKTGVEILALMGSRDFLFLGSMRKVNEIYGSSVVLRVINGTGHVVHLEAPDKFHYLCKDYFCQ